MTKKVILVTGASGFVGSAVCRDLGLRGYSVVQTTRRYSAVSEASVTIKDLDGGTDWSRALADVEAVVHLAARVHVMKDAAADPLAAFRRVNVAGTRRLAETAAENGVKRFLFLSSVKVHGEQTGKNTGPFTEETETKPQDPYALSKWEAERVLQKIDAQYRMEVVVIRPPLVYGPGVKANFRKLIALVDQGVPLPLGCVSNRRSLLSLTNLVDLIGCSLEHPKAAGETFLASDGEDVSTPELVRRIALAMDKSPRLIPIPERLLRLGGTVTGKTAQVARLCGSLQIDSSKVRRRLGWIPPCSMEEELLRIGRWWKAGRLNTELAV